VLRHLYHVRVWNGEDGYLVAQCKELPAAITQGKTKEEIVENITEAIRLVLADMQSEVLEKTPILVEE
jgi:predicted RNase H-like HicB family nuclease